METVDIIEVHGEHESGEGVCLWGYALYNYTCCQVVAGPLYRTIREAQTARDNYETELREALNPTPRYTPEQIAPENAR